jgi:hypothetical protein
VNGSRRQYSFQTEGFEGMEFVNSPRIIEDDQLLKIEAVSINANAIAVFMFSFWLMMAAILFFFDGSLTGKGLAVGGIIPCGIFVGLFYLLAERDRNRVLPFVEKKNQRLVLACGIAIAKERIKSFNQYTCVTKISRFRLVLTTVVTHEPEGTREYAVLPVIGDFSEDRVGSELAKFFNAPLIRDNNRSFTVEELAKIGIS